MRWSIKKIFNNLSTTLLSLSIMLGLLAFVTFTQDSAVEKMDLLLEQKALVNETYNLGREEIQYTNIQLKGIVDNLRYDIDKMQEAFSFDVLGNYIFGHSAQYLNDLKQLSIKQLLYIEAAEAYYYQSIEDLPARLDDYDFAQAEYLAKLSEIQEKHTL